jgi:signal transduction histidine kinase
MGQSQSANGSMNSAHLVGSRILLVDATPSAETLGAVLRHDGYDVEHVDQPQDAQELLRRAQYDLVIVDMPEENAAVRSLLARLRNTASTPTSIVLARYASLDTALGALRAGAYDYLVEPIDIEELRLTLTHALERRRLQQELADRVRELEAAHAQLSDFNHQLHQRIEEATVELQEKVIALDEANHKLEAAQEQHQRFIAMVAHEMRGPLGPIMNFALMAKRPSVSADKRDEYLDLVVDQAKRMSRLVDDLQTATRLSTGRFTLKTQPTDLSAAVQELVNQFASSHRDRAFRFTTDDQPVIADVDSDRILQAVRNLIDNAIKYTGEGSAIEVEVHEGVDTATVAVGDYGAGIPEAQMERIFQAYTQLRRDDDEASGSGLGLYITRGIVAAHGGALMVRNRDGAGRLRGAIFTITLPRRSQVSAPPTGEPDEPDSAPPDHSSA